MSIEKVLSGEMRWHIACGDCLDIMKTMPDNSVDALCTDPPAGVSFMQMSWDSDRGGRDQWIEWLTGIMREALRVMKPGAHGLVWALPRTSHWTGMALDNAGFQIRDRVAHIFSTGFPKSSNLSKAADKVVGAKGALIATDTRTNEPSGIVNAGRGSTARTTVEREIRAPATAAAAAALQGWGSALKPAVEDWWLIRKPFRGSLIQNVLDNGAGGLNIDGCRVPHANAADLENHAAGVAAIKARGGSMDGSWKNSSDLAGASDVTAAGRWPAHLALSHSSECKRVGVKKVKAAPSWNDNRGPSVFTGAATSPVVHAAADGTETVEEWECAYGCAVAALNEQSGESTSTSRKNRADTNIKFTSAPGGIRESFGHADIGGASRFFNTFEADEAQFLYEPKPSRSERESGLEEFLAHEVTDGRQTTNDTPYLRDATKRRNVHPTVKSTKFMRWCCRMVTPPGGIVLDIFTGSGSTGVAASAEGLRFVGIEQNKTYVDIARARIVGDSPLFNRTGSEP